MSTKHKTHLIRAEASNATTWCGKISNGGGTGKHVLHFATGEGGEFFATRTGALADCKLCLDALDRARR